jgi:NAD-dependent SIR2 family protein deacetylase
MEYRDKSLVCVECHQPFVWTAGEQLFYADKNFKNEPKRCKECKKPVFLPSLTVSPG